jgi:cell division protein FtsQ
VEGPNGGYRHESSGRRAGEASGQGVRDWQKNTWFGPAPLNSNPFDEPEDAPELKDVRSENVNQRMGDFWQTQRSDGIGNRDSGTETVKRRPRSAVRKEKEKRKYLPALLIVLLTLIAAVLVLRFAVFTVRDIQVTGNRDIPASEIIRISGIRLGDSILTINENAVGQRIASDYRLQFRYMIRDLPQTVVLSIREREECCWLTYCGITYVMDKNRMVLREEENPAYRPENLVEVKGLEVRSNTMVGQQIILGNEKQQEILSSLFLHMKVLGCTGEIKEADMSNTDSILLETRDGYTVSLGDIEDLHAKLRSMLLVREKLRDLQMTGGTINVSIPEIPIYNP